MSIKGHHGPPGSYKTSGAVQDDFIRAALAGRHVITNVRGLSDADHVRTVLKGVPDSFTITHIDDTSEEQREVLRRWFHWAPKGALIFIDEVNTIYPKAWGVRDLARYDYPGGVDAAAADSRPATLVEAFEKHRHGNWDIVLTTPNFKKIHPAIVECMEGGYRHVNRAMVGIKGSYLEIFHLADNSGQTLSNEITVEKKRIKKYVFELYKSTTTGDTHDTQAGKNVFFSTKALLFVVCFGLAISFLVWRGPPSTMAPALGHPQQAGIPGGGPGAAVSGPGGSQGVQGGVAGGSLGGGPLVPGQGVQAATALTSWLKSFQVFIIGEVNADTLISFENKNASLVYRASELVNMEIHYEPINKCFGRLKYEGREQIVTCTPEKNDSRTAILPAAMDNMTGGG